MKRTNCSTKYYIDNGCDELFTEEELRDVYDNTPDLADIFKTYEAWIQDGIDNGMLREIKITAVIKY